MIRLSGGEYSLMQTKSGTLKWFDAKKGFGFIADAESGKDILLHANVLRNFGYSSVVEGAQLEVSVVETERGLQSAEIFSLNLPEPSSDTVMRSIAELGINHDDIDFHKPLEPARVKWFDKGKGFGFVNAFGQGDDVFVHMEVLRAYGISELVQGEAVAVRTANGPRGPMAVEVRAWDFQR